MTDFFISYNKADRKWAEWIAWTLEENGYTVVIQAWDFRPGGNFVLEMQRATRETKKTLAILSDSYLQAEYTHPEWADAFRRDPKGEERTLIPVRVDACQPDGLLGSIIYIDLVDQPPPEARKALLAGMEPNGRPDEPPPFPVKLTENRVIPSRANFPGIIWNAPERNAFFTGRETILEDLHQRLTQENTAALSQTEAISGSGGIGKTQTVVEYAHRHRQDYQAIFWVRSETETELINGFVESARLLDLPQKDAQDPQEAISAVKRWLAENENWLLIFDNADDVKLLKPYRPTNARGQILLTSRAQVFGSLGIAKPVTLEQMEPQEALEFLFKRTGKDLSNSAERDAAIELVEELERYPLALEQAGAYIQEEDCRIQDYLTIFRKDRLVLLEKYGPVTGNYPASVATTWNLNFQQVEEQSVVSADILRVSAFLSPDAIPDELFTLGASKLGDTISNALGNDDQTTLVVNEHLTPLARYSLIRREPVSIA